VAALIHRSVDGVFSIHDQDIELFAVSRANSGLGKKLLRRLSKLNNNQKKQFLLGRPETRKRRNEEKREKDIFQNFHQ